jgi:hypothetical protein
MTTGYCVMLTLLPSMRSQATTLPSLKRKGILVIFSNFSSWRQKNPKLEVEKPGLMTTIAGRRGGAAITLRENRLKGFFLTGLKLKGGNLGAIIFCAAVAPTTKTVQKIKKISFMFKIQLLCM